MSRLTPITQTQPLGMVGGCKFGRYPKISLEETFNFIISDNFLVNFAGYKSLIDINGESVGRALYSCTRFNAMIAVIGSTVYAVTSSRNTSGQYTAGISFIGNLETSSGDVFIAENNGNQIAICDKVNIYIFNYQSSTFTTLTPTDLGFTPGYMDFQDGYFLTVQIGDTDLVQWRLSAPNDGTSWPSGASNVGQFQTKADQIMATVRVPGKGGLLYVFGQNVVEQWVDTGQNLFPYQRTSYTNIDYGVLNAATIARNDTIVVWLGSNRVSGPVIMYSDGGDPVSISSKDSDGIDFKLANVIDPQSSYASLFKQDGHLIYMLTFYGSQDNFTLIYDFKTSQFSYVTDNKKNAHIAKKVVFFNNAYFFVSNVDGKFYQLSSNFYDGDGEIIPRIRTTRNFRLTNSNLFVGQNINFVMEQGESIDTPVLQFSMSKNGAEDFSNIYSRNLNTLGFRPNRVNYWNLGAANDFVFQFTFAGHGRFVIGDGEFNFYQ